jgi:hypothetical protein
MCTRAFVQNGFPLLHEYFLSYSRFQKASRPFTPHQDMLGQGNPTHDIKGVFAPHQHIFCQKSPTDNIKVVFASHQHILGQGNPTHNIKVVC